MKQTLLCQAVVPDYRLPLFAELKRRQGEAFRLLCGQEGLIPALQTCAGAAALSSPIRNRLWLGRTFLWQSDLLPQAEAADLVITEFNLRTVSTWFLLARRYRRGRPTILWGHAAGRRRSMDWLKRWMFRRCDGFISYTRSQAAQLRREFPSLPIWVASNAVMWRQECRFLPRPPAEVDTIIYVGRLVAEKRPWLLLEAFLQAAGNGSLPPEARLRLVGDGPERAALSARATASGLGSRIEFTGHVAGIDRLRELYAPAVCSVSPGYVGLSATQSFGFGVPMLVADGEAHSPEIEACEPRQNAEFFPSGDAPALARALADFYRGKALWLERREAICRATAEHYSLDAMADTFESAIQHFLAP